MPTATVTSKGQITIPQKVREHLRLGAGDKVDFVIEEGGTVRVRAVCRSVRSLYGFLKRPGRPPVSVQEMNEAVVEHLVEEDARIRSGVE